MILIQEISYSGTNFTSVLTNRTTFLINASSNNVVFVLRILVNLFVTPVCLNLFGVEIFGAYLFSFGLVTSLGFLDFGISKGILRFTAEYYRDNDIFKFEKALSAGLIINLFTAGMAAVLMIALGANFNLFFNIDLAYAQVASNLFFVSAAYAFGYFFSLMPLSILQGAQRFKERNMLQLILLCLNGIAIGSLAYLKFSIVWFCGVNTIISFIGIGFDLWLIKRLRLLQGINFSVPSFRGLLESDFFKYSKRVFGLSTITMLSTQMDKVILSVFGNVSLVAVYSVITKPYSLVKAIFMNALVAMEPIIVSKSYNLIQLRSLIVRTTRISLSILTPTLILIIILFNPIIRLWTQKDIFSTYTIWGVVSLVGLGIAFSYSIVYRTIYLSGHIGELIKVERISSVLNGLVSLTATFYLGVGGVILGTFVQSIINYFFLYRKSVVHFSIGQTQMFDWKFVLVFLVTIAEGIGLYLMDSYFLSGLGELVVLLKFGIYFFVLLVPAAIYIWNEKLLLNHPLKFT